MVDLSLKSLFEHLPASIRKFNESQEQERIEITKRRHKTATKPAAAPAFDSAAVRKAKTLEFIAKADRATRDEIMKALGYKKAISGEAIRSLLAEKKIVILSESGRQRKQILGAKK